MKHLSALLLLALSGCALSPEPADTDPYTIVSDEHLVRDIPARAPDGRVHMLVEIPAGTNAKWEVDKKTGNLMWELRDGEPRVVRFLPYPANYGMIPGTLLPEEHGGDGDPLDVVLLGPAAPRGRVLATRLVGVLLLVDQGERDDKLLAVASGGPFADVSDLADLEERHPGVTSILETWFTSYKGPGEVEAEGFAGRARANQILSEAIDAYAGQT